MCSTPFFLALFLWTQVVHITTAPPPQPPQTFSLVVHQADEKLATLEFSLQDNHVELVDAFAHKHNLGADAKMAIFRAMLEEGLAHDPSYLPHLRAKRLRPSTDEICSLPSGSPLPAGFTLYHDATTNSSTPSGSNNKNRNSGNSYKSNLQNVRSDITAVDTVWQELNELTLIHDPSATPQWHVRPVQVVSMLDALDALNTATPGQRQTYCEVGFMMGHSAAAVLVARPHVHVLSFDLFNWKYSDPIIELFESRWGNRFTSVVGDSIKTIPEFHANHPEFRCDVIFIDGGHLASTVFNDAINMRKLVDVHANNVVFFDDSMKNWKKDSHYVFNALLDCGTDAHVHFPASNVEQILHLGEEISLLRSVKTHRYQCAHPCNPIFYAVGFPWAWSEAWYNPEFDLCSMHTTTTTRNTTKELLALHFRTTIFAECESSRDRVSLLAGDEGIRLEL